MPRNAPRLEIRKRPYEALFNKFQYTCARDKKQTSLTYEDFLEITNCPFCEYCGSDIAWTKHHLHGNSHRYNLDRKDNLEGYHKGNVVACCWECNQIKGSRLSHGEMKVAMKAILEYRKDRPAGLLLREPSSVPAGQTLGFHNKSQRD